MFRSNGKLWTNEAFMDEQTAGRESKGTGVKSAYKNGKRKNICSDAAAVQRKEYYNHITYVCERMRVQQLIKCSRLYSYTYLYNSIF